MCAVRSEGKCDFTEADTIYIEENDIAWGQCRFFLLPAQQCRTIMGNGKEAVLQDILLIIVARWCTL